MPDNDDRFWKGILFWSTLCVLPVALIASINAMFSLATILGKIHALFVLLAFLTVLLNVLRRE